MRAKAFGTLNTLLIENLRRCSENPTGFLNVITARQAVFTVHFDGHLAKRVGVFYDTDLADLQKASERNIIPKKGAQEEFSRVARALLDLNGTYGNEVPQFTIFQEQPPNLSKINEHRPGNIGIELLHQISIREALNAFYFELHEVLLRHPAFLSFRWEFKFDKVTRSLREKAADPSVSYEELVIGRERYDWFCEIRPYIDPKLSSSGEASKREHRMCQASVTKLLETYSMLYPVFAQAGPQSISCAEIRQHMAMASAGLLSRLHSLDEVFDVKI